jgi:hypothetical protein
MDPDGPVHSEARMQGCAGNAQVVAVVAHPGGDPEAAAGAGTWLASTFLAIQLGPDWRWRLARASKLLLGAALVVLGVLTAVLPNPIAAYSSSP